MPEDYDFSEESECLSFANSDLEEEVDNEQEYKRYEKEMQEKNDSLKKMEFKKAKINYIMSGLKPIYLVGERWLKNYYTDFKTEEVQKLNNKQINSIPEAYALRLGEIYNISKTEIKVAFEFITSTSHICECRGCKYVIRGEGGGELIRQDTEILKGKHISEIISRVVTENSNEIDDFEFEGFIANVVPDCTPDVM